MEIGLATNFAATPDDPAGVRLLAQASRAGFTFVELPADTVRRMTPEAFENLRNALTETGLSCTACNMLFPEDIALTGPDYNPAVTTAMLDESLARLSQLGAKKAIFAQVRAWRIPSAGRERAISELAETIRRSILPVCRRYGLQLLLEPIRRSVCDLINTPDEAYELADLVGETGCGVMLDLYHLRENGIEAQSLDLPRMKDVTHIHIAGRERQLPPAGGAEELLPLLAALFHGGCRGDLCLETRAPENEAQLLCAGKWMSAAMRAVQCQM